ncbi:MAG TPA: bifunctional pyr operon transcriptional regulator/uracil phosphoribosyltransferase PyrR [Jatrophihabitantaceae bacterium]
MPSAALTPNAPSATVLDAHDLARTVDRIAHQIIERTAKSDAPAALVGIPTRGVPLARRLADRIRAFDGPDIPIGSLDTTLYRDDLRLHGVRPLAETIEPRGGITDRLVILVDDVLFSGRTIRAALDAIRDLGRPSAVQLAVLVDRGHRQLPIRADYVGKNLPTSVDQNVRVMLSEIDGSDAVLLTGPVGQGGDSE